MNLTFTNPKSRPIQDSDILTVRASNGREHKYKWQDVNSFVDSNVDITTVAAATYDLLLTDSVLHVTYTSTGAVTSLTLPTAGCISGRNVVIKDAGGGATANNITIDTEGSETIDGAATAVIGTDYNSINLYCDGTNWFIY
jgi:hypothetical protein